MKNLVSLATFSFLIAISVFLFPTCDLDGILTGDGPLISSIPSSPGTIAIAFLEADGSRNIERGRVFIEDPNDKVRSFNGVDIDSLDILDGVITLALDKSTTVSANQPYRFLLKVVVNGYYPLTREIIIDTPGPVYVPVYLISREVAPTGMFFRESTTKMTDGVFTNSLSISSPTGNINTSNNAGALINFQEGTILYANKKRIDSNGTAFVRLLYAPPGTDASARIFPGGFMTTEAYSEIRDSTSVNAQPVRRVRLATPESPLYFLSAGWFTLEMTTGNVAIDSFDRPARGTLFLNDTLIHPGSNRRGYISEGDTIPLWYFREKDGVWFKQGEYPVQSMDKTGQKYVVFPLYHLSTYAFAPVAGACANPLQFVYPAGVFRETGYAGQLISAVNGQYLRYSFPVTFPAGNPPLRLDVNNAPTGVNMALLVKTQSGAVATDTVSAGVSKQISCSQPGGTIIPVGAPANPDECLLIDLKDKNGTRLNLGQNSVWHKDNCGNATPYELAALYSTAEPYFYLPKIPAQGNKCFLIWYMENNQQVSLQFNINTTVADNVKTNLSIQKKTGGVLSPPISAEYVRVNSGVANACTKKIVISLK